MHRIMLESNKNMFCMVIISKDKNTCVKLLNNYDNWHKLSQCMWLIRYLPSRYALASVLNKFLNILSRMLLIGHLKMISSFLTS